MVYCHGQNGVLQRVKFLGLFRFRNKMRLKSALEDFEANTLESVSGLLARLSYVGGLHDGKGAYEHWGLAKAHGPEAAQRAIRESHRELLAEVLKEPLGALLNDLLASSANEHLTEREFLAALTGCQPKPVSPAALAHLRSVLGALSALVESRVESQSEGRDDANSQDAERPRRPGRGPRHPAGV